MRSLLRALPSLRSTAPIRAFATSSDIPPITGTDGNLETIASTSTISTTIPAASGEILQEPKVIQGQWSPYTQRTGVIARKRGMTALWDKDGRRWPVTVLQLDSCQVIRHSPPPPLPQSTNHAAHKPSPTSHLHTLQLGSSNRPIKTTPAPQLGQFASAGVSPKYKLLDFRVTPDAILPVGTEISAAHFVPGQMVDVTATSIGKGFQGPMKRHGFKGLKASHGVSLTHRSGGSTGQHQDPGRVLPGKKMAGHMGSVKRTQQNLIVHRIDTQLNCVFVRGGVPGPDDAYVSVRDAKKGLIYKAQARFKKGMNKEEWAGRGVGGLPTPGMDVRGVRDGGWGGSLEWSGVGAVGGGAGVKK